MRHPSRKKDGADLQESLDETCNGCNYGPHTLTSGSGGFDC